MTERATVERPEGEVSRSHRSRVTGEGPNEKESWKVMNLGNAPHQKSGKPERVVSGKGEAQADAARDEERPAFHKQEGLVREG